MISALTLTLVLTAAPAKATQTKSARDEIARLEKELAEQKALLIKILQMQIEHSQQLLKLAQGQQVTIAAVEAPPPVEKEKPVEKPAPVVEKEKPAEKEKPVAKAQPEKEAPAKGGKGQTATVTGKVKVSGTNGPAWVFIEDEKGTAGGGAASRIARWDGTSAPADAESRGLGIRHGGPTRRLPSRHRRRSGTWMGRRRRRCVAWFRS